MKGQKESTFRKDTKSQLNYFVSNISIEYRQEFLFMFLVNGKAEIGIYCSSFFFGLKNMHSIINGD